MSIDHENIERLASLPEPGETDALRVLKTASKAKGLSLEEAATLLAIKEPNLAGLLIKTAAEVKETVFGKRIVLFAPLYLSNHCTNGCRYCGFRSGSNGIARKALSVDEAVTEAQTLEGMGFKRVLLVTGEDPRWGIDYIVSCVRAIYDRTGIRIVHVNAPPMETDSLKELKASGAGVYQSFQETYHRPTYELMHPFGRKKDYDFRLGVMDRAMEAGFGDVGIGPLLGLYDYRFDALATISHSLHLYNKFGAHAHTISIPRLRPAEDGLKDVPMRVTDLELKKIVAVFRLSVPSAGIVASTREPASLRAELIHAGATQLSAASRTNPGGYAGKEASLEQFSTTDHRGLAEVMKSVVDEGLLPSLCTACYRVGRTGGDFTGRTIAGEMEKFCQANAILTLKEYLLDFCSNGTRESVERAIDEGLAGVKDQGLKEALILKLDALEKGKRDQYF
ncbi:MAG: [FeFe] hydrogenase H-cluster radical SAM maturase HydG [Candidatus Methylomirabilis sp.]|nr:[FeFe] hydrogenase H-cluster radical SAM maturase HydG [Deltaproteobacteria bacterium]